MYLIKKFDQVTRRTEVLAEITDPARAYEIAHELDAACNLGRDDDDTDKGNPCIITIEDEDGNDVWQECSLARCPVAKGLFQ
ncbi:hypothetical protein LCGC14_2930270 [marine sediment metagenome]|uniref:Uncharacterized protein n=1 Tax=marine sediment metagenome TaxID=412755 RepID=A0A0F8XL32_9ZZZZ